MAIQQIMRTNRTTASRTNQVSYNDEKNHQEVLTADYTMVNTFIKGISFKCKRLAIFQ